MAGVAGLVRHCHAHVDDGQCVHEARREAKDVRDHQKAVVVRTLLARTCRPRFRLLSVGKSTAQDHQQQGDQQRVVGDGLGQARSLLNFHNWCLAKRGLGLKAPQRAHAEGEEHEAAHAAGSGTRAGQGGHGAHTQRKRAGLVKGILDSKPRIQRLMLKL